MTQRPTSRRLITLPLTPDVVQIEVDPEVKMTRSPDDALAVTVNVSLE